MKPDVAAHRPEKALAMLREHAASLDPDSFVSEVIRVLEGEDEAPTAAHRQGFAYIEVDDETVGIGLLCGLMQKARDEDVIELTEKGTAWLREWCQQKIKEAEANG